jgi:CBS domain-containing protein
MTILRLCDKESAAVPPESTVAEAVRLMLARRVGAVVVVDANRVVGIFTERDVLKKLALSGRDPEKVPVSELMTTPVETASPQTSPGDALASMLEHHFRHLPVVDSSGRLRGVLSIRNLLQGQMEELRRQRDSLEQYVASEGPGVPKARD